MPAQDLVIVLRVDDKGTRVIKQFATKGTTAFKKLGAETKKTSSKFKAFKAQAKSSFATFATGLLPVMGMMGAINLLRRSFTEMIRTGREYETAMANVATLTRQSQEEVERMRDAMLDLSPTLGKAADMAGGLYQAISAGIPIGKDGAIAIGFLEVAAKTAKAGLSSMDATVRLLASTMNAYNMQMGTSEEAIKSVSIVSDILFGTVKYGITTMKELVASIPRITSTAAALRIPLTEVGAALAALTARGLTTRIAVLSLNRMLMTFVKTTPKSASAAKALGLEWDAAGVIIGGIPHIIEQISKATVNVTPEIRRFAFESNNVAEIQRKVADAMGMNVTKLAQLFPNVSSLRAALMLTADQGERFREILKGMEEGVKGLGGTFSWTEEAMKRHMSTATFWMSTMENIFDKFKIQFFLGITESFRQGIASQEDFQAKVDEWTKVAGKKVKEFAMKMVDVIKKGIEFAKVIGKVAKELLKLWLITKGMRLAAPFLGASKGVAGFLRNVILAQKGVGALRLKGIGLGGVMGKLGLVGATAFAAWQVGRMIGKLTGLDNWLQNKMFPTLYTWLGIVKDINKEVERGPGHYKALEMRTEALGKATKIVGEEITNITDAKKILYKEWKATGDLGSATLNDWIKKMVDLKAVDDGNLKTTIDRRKEQEKLGNEIDDLFNAMKELESGTSKQITTWKTWTNKATSGVKGVYDSVQNMKKEMKEWVIEFKVTTAKDFVSRAKDAAQLLADIETELYEKNVVAKMSEVQRKLYENRQYHKGLLEQIEAEKKADQDLYKSKVEELDKYFALQRENLNARITDAYREVGIHEEIARAKLAISAATKESELANAKAQFASRVEVLRASGVEEIATTEATAREVLEKEKEGLDERIKYYDYMKKQVLKSQKETSEGIIKGTSTVLSGWKKMNKEIEADTIRSIANIIKSGGNLWEGLKGIFDNITNYWIDKVVNQMVKGGAKLWDTLKKGFSGLSKSFSSVFTNIGGAVSGLGGIVGGSVGKATDVVGGLIGKFGKLAGPIGAAISIGMKLPIIGDVIKGITGKVTKLLSKIPLIGKLFKKSETEAEKAARLLDEMIKGLTGSVSKFGDVTEDTATNIAEAITSGMQGFAAVSKYYGDVLKDVGITQESINDQWMRAGDIINHMKEGFLSTEEGVDALTDSFTQLLKGAQDFGTEGSKAMSDFIKMVRESGTEVQAVTDYINDQLGVTKASSMSAAQGLAAMAANTLPGLTKLIERQTELNDKIAGVKEGTPEWNRLNEQLNKVNDTLAGLAEKVEAGKGSLASLERRSMAVFNAMIANGATYAEAMDSIGGTLDIIAQKHADLGTEAGAGIQELMKIREVTQEHQGLFNAIDGNLAVMNALANTGSLTQEVLQDSANSAKGYYNQLVNAGLNGNQALAQMAPTLERLRFLSEEHNLELDKGTLALIEQAEQAGILKEQEMSMQETMMAGFGMLLDALGVDLPNAMQKSVDKLKDMEDAMAGSGVVSALELVKTTAESTFGSMTTQVDGLTTKIGAIETKLGDASNATDIMKTKMIESFNAVNAGIGEAESGIRGLEGTIRRGKFTLPFDIAMPKIPKPISAQGGFEGRIKEPVQPFIAHKGEYLKIWRKGESEMGGQTGANINVTIEPVAIPKENETVLNFVVKRIEKGDVRIPISSVRGN